MQPTRCPSSEQLRAFLAATLPDSFHQAVSDHLRSCTQCSGQLQQLPALSGDGLVPTLIPTLQQNLGPAHPQGREEALSPATQDCGPRHSSKGKAEYPFLLPPQQPDEIGRLGNYRVLRLLGQGGMGFVFQAEDLALLRPVALKVMNPQVHGMGEGGQRFLREARIMAAIKHDHLVTVYQAGQEGEVYYLAMELLQGEALSDFLRRTGPCGTAEVLRLGQEMAQGLAGIHSQGLIHRDIKPTNIWLEVPRGRVKILDFGLARFVHEDARLTQSGTVLGTPSFMSPEQARGAALDARSDLFSLGCVLYCLCSGRPPFEANSVMGVLTALAVDHPRPVQELNPTLPQELDALILQLLAKNPSDRPATALEVHERLLQIEAHLASPSPTLSSADSRLNRVPSEKTTPKKSALRRGIATVLVVVLTMVIATAAVQLTPLFAPQTVAKGPQTVQAKGTLSPPPLTLETPVLTVQPDPPRTELASPEKIAKAKEKTADAKAAESRSKPAMPEKSSKTNEKTISAEPTLPRGEEEIVYLKDLVPIQKEHWPFSLPEDHGPNGKSGPPRGGPGPKGMPRASGGSGPGGMPPPPGPLQEVRVQGRSFPLGLFMHPPVPPFEGQPTSLTYRLPKAFTRFKAVVSLNDGPERSATPLTFEVFGDGLRLWSSRPVMTQRDVQTVDLAIRGKTMLKLQVSCRGDTHGAHAAWIDPRVSR